MLSSDRNVLILYSKKTSRLAGWFLFGWNYVINYVIINFPSPRNTL
jgi:hypothetical protein